MNRNKSVFLIIVMILTILLVRSPSPTHAQFVIAGWDYPDEYGQGINVFDIFENSTGDWLYHVTGYSPSDSYAIEWEMGVAIKIRCYTSFNYTLTGAVSIADGKNYQRHSITVSLLGTTVFSQQNFTYYSSGEYAGLYWYNYDVILNFLPDPGQIYIATVTYEVFY